MPAPDEADLHLDAGQPNPAPFRRHDVLKSERVYDSEWCALDRHEIRVSPGDEATGEYHIFRVPNAIAVLPITTEGDVVMVWQHRHPHGRTHWEIPAGRISHGEPPAVAAERELLEETGFRAGELIEISGFFPINGISDHYAHVFLAKNCERVAGLDLDETERLLVRTRPLAEVKRQLFEGELQDGFTALTLFYGLQRLGKL